MSGMANGRSNDFVFKASRQKVEKYNFYSLVYDPMTTCGCCEAISAVLPCATAS